MELSNLEKIAMLGMGLKELDGSEYQASINSRVADKLADPVMKKAASDLMARSIKMRDFLALMVIV